MSEVSSTKYSASQSQISVLSGLSQFGFKPSKKPKNLHHRKYKENSIYEEEWLVDSINNLKIDEEEEKQLIHLI